jgi:Holliday junction resolvase RusA-like endonuclease
MSPPASVPNLVQKPIAVELPMPPSVNTIWRRGKGRTYLNPTYAKWKSLADQHLMVQRVGKGWRTIEGWFDVVITLPEKKRGKMDADNRAKAALDWSQQAGIVENDKWVNTLLIQWGDAPLGFKIEFTPVKI